MYVEDELVKNILDGAAEKSLKKIRENGTLTLEDAIPLLLKGQYNHILHLDKEITAIKKKLDNTATKDDIKDIRNEMKGMATKDDIKDIRNEMKGMATKDDIKMLKWVMGVGLGIITVMIGLLTIFGLK